MIKKGIAYIISFSLLFSAMQQSFIYLHYLSNIDYYANVLCENKTKPQMHCHGKCQIMKEMKEQEKQQKSPVFPVKDKHQEIQFAQTEKQFSWNAFSDLTKYNTAYIIHQFPEVVFSIFHPPSC